MIELRTILEKELYEIAQVYLFEDLKDKGLFGVPSEKLLERVGNLVILPKENNTCLVVWKRYIWSYISRNAWWSK